MDYKEVTEDLFTMSTDYALAHCISRDCALGAGIAKKFRRRYPSMCKTIKETNPSVGDAVVYDDEGQVIFNLVTKEKYWNKPTKETFKMSIVSLKRELVDRDISKLAIPQLGAGLDRLDWNKNREVIKDIFKDTDIEIVVCIWE